MRRRRGGRVAADPARLTGRRRTAGPGAVGPGAAGPGAAGPGAASSPAEASPGGEALSGEALSDDGAPDVVAAPDMAAPDVVVAPDVVAAPDMAASDVVVAPDVVAAPDDLPVPDDVAALTDVMPAGPSTAGPGTAGTDAAGQLAGEPDPVLSGRVISVGPPAAGKLVLSSQAGDAPAAGTGHEEEWLDDAIQAVLDWASRRSIGLSSACGIFVALAVCSAAWFSSGTRADMLRGVAALWAGYLALKAGQALPAVEPLSVPYRRTAPRPPARAAAGAVILEAEPTVSSPAPQTRWLAALGSCAAECAVYGGLAVGAVADRWPDVWPLAVAVVSLVAVRSVMSACSTPPGFGERTDGIVRQLSLAILTMPAGGRILLVGIVAPVWGTRAALLVLADWSAVSICYGLAGRAAPGVAGDPQAGRQGLTARTSLLLRLRDDGALARTLGNLVRGNLVPLPPAALGLLAVAGLGLLGLHGLPAVLMLGPVIVLLLAAPGSSHPHTGRLDWLVPALLLGAQMLYLIAIGRGAGVPGPVIFALAATLLLRYADLAFPARPVLLARLRQPAEARGERGTALGWEGRLLIAGIAAAMGIATYAYLALTVYLVLLIGVRAVTSSARPPERERT